MSTDVRTISLAHGELEVGSRSRLSAIAAWFLLVVSLQTWRTGIYYSGGFDSVVIAKAGLDVIAFALACSVLGQQRVRPMMGPRTVLIVFGYVAVSVIGAAAAGNFFASSVLGVRLLLVFGTTALLVVALPFGEMIAGLVLAMGVTGLVCAVTGVGSVLAGERLTGGLLPIAPANQLGLLVGVPIIWAVWQLAQGKARWWHLGVLAGGLGLTWLTGSRSGLAALLLACAIVVVLAPRVRLGSFLALAAAVPAAFYFVAFTGQFSAYFGRGGDENLLTLNSRTIAWHAAFAADTDFWRHWFGGGLSVKLVSVSGTFWDSQVLDSSWVSAFVQVGVIGLVLLSLWVVTTLWRTMAAPHAQRGLLLALAVYAVIRSVLQTGLLDSYTLFLVFLVPSLMGDLRRPRPPAPEDVGRGTAPLSPRRS